MSGLHEEPGGLAAHAGRFKRMESPGETAPDSDANSPEMGGGGSCDMLELRRRQNRLIDPEHSRRASDYTAVKKELDTLAVNADAELRATQRLLLDLVTYAQPSTFSPQE